MREDLINDLLEIWKTLSEDEIKDIARVGGYDLTKDIAEATGIVEKSMILCIQNLQRGCI